MQNNNKTYFIILLLLLFYGNKGKLFQYGKYLNSNTSSSITKLYLHGPKTCAKECVYLPECKSFSWKNFECAIYTENESTSEILTMTSSDAVYGERGDAVKVVTNGCKQNTCPENHKCVPLRNSRKTCVKIVCAHAPPLFNFTTNAWNGKRSDVGTVINYVCNTGYQLVSGSGNVTCRKDGKWDKGEIVCQKIVTCPNSYQYESSIKFCYKVVDSWFKWSVAKQSCQENGGDLVTVDTDDKFNILNESLTLHHRSKCVLTSAKRNGTSWFWSNGISFDVTKHVRPQTQSILPGENCLCQMEEYWYSRDCENTSVFVCENVL